MTFDDKNVAFLGLFYLSSFCYQFLTFLYVLNN